MITNPAVATEVGGPSLASDSDGPCAGEHGAASSIRWPRLLAAVALLTATACSSLTDAEREPPARDRYRLLFFHTPPAARLGQLALLEPEDGRVTLLPVSPGAFDNLRSSPDGRKLLFTRTAGAEAPGVYVMNVEGSELRPLPNVGAGYAWSPDGTRIASLIAVNAGTRFVRITDAQGAVQVDFPHVRADHSRPSWSPDAAGLVFAGDVRHDGWLPDLFVAASDGSRIANLSSTPGYEWEPAWSPTGSAIAFFAIRDGVVGLFSMRPDGTAIRLLYPGAENVGLRWAPDGSKLLFTGPGAREFESRLLVLNADGRTRVLASGALEGLSAAWSPDGRWVAFAKRGAEGHNIYLVRPDGSGLREVTPGAVQGRSPVWVAAR